MQGFEKELTTNILPFWINRMQDNEQGGFYGCIDGNNKLHKQANKGAVLNARLLWTFSAAYRILMKEEYKAMATRAFHYLRDLFLDNEQGGVYWELDYQGNPVNTKKQVYAQGFALYGLSEYHRATGNNEALELAIQLFHLIERYKDNRYGGYFEAFTRDWKPIEDMRLSDKDANEKKSMNTHLHILEPYTNLLRVWDNDALKATHKELIHLFVDHIVSPQTFHQYLFFEEDWNVKSSIISYGHDIEASWLLYEAAEVLGDTQLLSEIKEASLKIADAAAEGIIDNAMIYEKNENHIDRELHWWVQAEAVVGFMYAYQHTNDKDYYTKAERVWHYIQKQIVDHEQGEWIWSRFENGEINRKDDKAGFWKCPYHNGRMCMEMMEHFNLK
ncbi:AGE family epimerase/isomerase [Parabacteroides sp. OttesenSCG-928-N08]|nr:AGE family epimerase/isomerase [Parabacteroides sp. OttesenSCG-928-N08]